MSESRFDTANNDIFDQNVGETDKYTSIMLANKYEFMSNTYFGTGGYRDGQYIIPHQRELFLRNRKELSAYRNFLRPILDSLITPVFNEEATRVIQDTNGNEVQAETLFSTFLADTNNNGEAIQDFVEQATTYARLHGVCFVVMDNFAQDDQPETTVEAIENRILPYCYIRTANDVETYSLDNYGKITSIIFEEQPVFVNGKKQERYREWTDTYSVVMGRECDSQGNQKETLKALESPVVHGLGVIPVIPVYSTKKRNILDILVEPPMFDIARLNHQLFNKDSCIIDQERAQAFSNFYVQGDASGDMVLGAHNVIFVPMEATMPPGFASPDANILAGLVANSESLKESIFQIAQQNGVYGIKEASSGLAMSYDFYAQEYQLHKTVYIASSLESSMADLFQKYTGEEFIYTVSYPEEFQPGNTKAIIETYKLALDMGVPEEFKRAIYEKMARMLFSDDDEETLKNILDGIYNTQEASDGPGVTGDPATSPAAVKEQVVPNESIDPNISYGE